MQIEPIAHFQSPFQSKFGVPKQSNLVTKLHGRIVFEPEYRNPDMLRGIEEFDYLWLIWGFSANPHAATSPLVRPPLLGGNQKVGVFASRSPFRPNALGLSSVRISHIEEESNEGPVVHVLGADLMDGTPIYDIKPYVSLSDSHPEARCGFVDNHQIRRLNVVLPERISGAFTKEQLEVIRQVLELDPRPHYQSDPDREYGMPIYGSDLKFRVEGNMLTVVGIQPLVKEALSKK